VKYFPAAVLILAALAGTAGAADRYPVKPIRIIAPAAPGSGADIISRVLGTWLLESWGQQVVTDNRPGAAGNIGSELAARATPDGYTLLLASSQQVVAPLFFDDPPYQLVRDFAPVILIASTPNVLSVHPSVAATSMKELIALAKAKPGTLNYGSSGTGGTQHLTVEMLKSMAGIDLVHVPYKSTVFALVDLMAGQVQLVISALPVAMPLIKQGKMRPLGVTSLKRTPFAPELEPIADTVPGYEALSWYGLVAPLKTPRFIVARLNAEIVRAMKTQEFKDKLNTLGAEPIASTPAEFAAFLSAQTDKLRRTVESSGMRSR
jgi:tripartite-type tricarboxylate transporter receptor subunit TctC